MIYFGEGENIIRKINPSLKPPIAKTLVGIFILIPGFYFYFSDSQIITYNINVLSYTFYFFGVLILFYGFSDIMRTLRTTYYVTNKRVLKEYKSPIKLEVNEIPISKIKGIETKRDIWENMFRLGHIVVGSGSGRHFRIQLRNIDHTEKIAEQIRNLLS